MKIWKIYGIKFQGEVIYIGQTGYSVDSRFFKHLQCAKEKGGSRIPKLYAHISSNNSVGYTFEMFEICTKENRNEREKYWVEFFNTTEKCNTTRGGVSARGKDHYLYGKHVDPKIWQASVAVRKGKKLSAEHRAAQREGHRKRKERLNANSGNMERVCQVDPYRW